MPMGSNMGLIASSDCGAALIAEIEVGTAVMKRE